MLPDPPALCTLGADSENTYEDIAWPIGFDLQKIIMEVCSYVHLCIGFKITDTPAFCITLAVSEINFLKL